MNSVFIKKFKSNKNKFFDIIINLTVMIYFKRHGLLQIIRHFKSIYFSGNNITDEFQTLD